MTSRKRERELARAKYERQQARRAKERERRRRLYTIVAAIAGVAVVVLGAAWLMRPASITDDAAASATPSPSASETSSASPSPSASTSSSVAAVTCTPPPASRPDNLTWPTAPPATLKPTGTYDITLTTNCGPIVIRVDQAKAPVTANSMVFLTDQKYFNDTACHRLTTAGFYVLQCGDPKGDGTGGPGYVVPDENLPISANPDYPAGTVAMANAGPGTAASQFFIVYEDTSLPPSYTIWGTVTSGLDIVKYVGAQGVRGAAGSADGAPKQPISIITGTTTYTPTGS
ncbi:MAG: peptidylprolyl isomerase [Actinobacteria bacterium]|uniref:Unannotated protein n=1 Tax=freshwater metagenome TaxID=449393 RepID=A0A6J7KX86_9ZZZZ|nr:peptidylprolyl isomerase [Actinomycetota bacterium]